MQAVLNSTLCCGSDLDIVNAARRSFNTKHQEFTEADKGLIQFLLKEKHLLPFRHPQLSFSCEAPIFVARQLGKHQVGMSWSEISRRYKTDNLKLWGPEQFREKPKGNIKQGTGADIAWNDPRAIEAGQIFGNVNNYTYDMYEELLELGIAPEQARAVLPQSTYVYWTWTGSLLSWLHLIKERNHPNAQKETREFVAEFISPVIAMRFPITWDAFEALL
jgi:thymidylate synthase (FAD)